MEFADFSPVPAPSLDQQRGALKKGLGRVVQWSHTGHLDDEPLLEACLQDLSFDTALEDSRGAWLWPIIETVNAIERFRPTILAALQSLPQGRDGDQLCELALHYSVRGDGAFRKRLYQIVEQRPFRDWPWLGEQQIVEQDGEPGFLFIARLRGSKLADRPWDWDDRKFVTMAMERLGIARVNGALEAGTDEGMQRFHARWLQDQRASEHRQIAPHSERMKQIPLNEIITAAESSETNFPYFRGWGIYASVTDLDVVSGRLFTATEPTIIAKYLKVFSKREFPQFDDGLIALCRHSDAEVRRRALAAMEQNSHPAIREFALEQLRATDAAAVGLLIKNYHESDEEGILEAIPLPDDECELHSLLMDVVDLLEGNPQADSSRLGVIAYGCTPCGNCRYAAARVLQDRKVAPAWLLEECRSDSESEIRRLVDQRTGQS